MRATLPASPEPSTTQPNWLRLQKEIFDGIKGLMLVEREALSYRQDHYRTWKEGHHSPGAIHRF